jgi:hypothetical protein
MSITSKIERVSGEYKTMEVPEWQVDGKPLKIFYTQLTVGESKKIAKRYPNFMEKITDAEVQVFIIIQKAMDEKGDPLFDIGDKNWFDGEDPLVVQRVVAPMIVSQSVEEQEKN